MDAPTKGTRKTLLVEMVPHISAGNVNTSTEARGDDEWRRRIGAWLSAGPVAIGIYNLKRRLDTGALAAVLTEDLWVDRQLGRNDAAIRYPKRALLIATWNGVVLSDEIARRTIPIYLDSGLERPYLGETNGFHHPGLRGWVTETGAY